VLYGTIAARVARVPAVVNAMTGLGYAFDDERARSFLGRTLALLFRHAVRHPRMQTIFQNAEDRDVFVGRGWLKPQAAVIVRGSGVDTSVFAPGDGPKDDPPLVVFASRLLASKGGAEFVEAARMVRASGRSARFVIAGEPDPDSPATITAEQLATWSDEGAVEVWGRRDDMAAVFRRASLSVLPTHYREGVPKVLIEAAAAGLPAVTTDTPGCRDIVADGETGLLVPTRDARALAGAIIELLDDPGRRRDMGRRARQRVLDAFSLDHVIEATLRVYAALLQ